LAQDAQFVQRFEDEISLLSGLTHPHIVKIHNVSMDRGKYFIVTDSIIDDSGDIANLGRFYLEKSSKLEEQSIFKILFQIAQALDYAHHEAFPGTPLIHRGIKLSNILIKKVSGEFFVYLSDYGISRIVGSKGVLTQIYKYVAEAIGISFEKKGIYSTAMIHSDKLPSLHQSFLQNYPFLAPEQKRGEETYKVDTYAFGVLAYYMIMGEFPEGYFLLPSKGVPQFKLNWDHLIISCLKPNPKDRPNAILPILKQLMAQKATPVIKHEGKIVDESKTPSSGQFLRPIIRSKQIDIPRHDIDPAVAIQVDTTVKQYQPEKKEINTDPIETEMVVIQGGVFLRGSNTGNRDEMPSHQVKINSFALDIHPVTNEQFVRFLEVMGGEKDRDHHDIIRLKDSRIKRSAGNLSIESGYSQHPAVGVTWYGAIAYAKWVGKRLPTEAEWEIAACGGDQKTLYPTGVNVEKIKANYFSSDTTAVMSYNPNPLQLYDMAGNVYEWCHDWYDYNYYQVSQQEPNFPKGPPQGVYRVLRGGCWKSLADDLRCSRRHRNNPGAVDSTYGFRCATDVQ
ncbi:SUMF1/EgtB/PvdO family nonheme iron enzyme, partial [Chlamydiales bacterium]|nr:SUMF1/EgtB/PvdO family nonheme iron enzyme [Chlamydiales bacterium]